MKDASDFGQFRESLVDDNMATVPFGLSNGRGARALRRLADQIDDSKVLLQAVETSQKATIDNFVQKTLVITYFELDSPEETDLKHRESLERRWAEGALTPKQMLAAASAGGPFRAVGTNNLPQWFLDLQALMQKGEKDGG